MNNVVFLLKQVNILRLKLLERQDKEEIFNLFSILLNERDEVNLHSRFISVLLDPKAPHKMGNTFLSLFLRVVESNMQVDDAEISITPNFLNPSEFKDIDIFIRKGNEFAVIIENKIDALDSNHEEEGQLDVNSTLAVSNIRNRTYTNCEVYLIDYGYGNFKEKIHFME